MFHNRQFKYTEILLLDMQLDVHLLPNYSHLISSLVVIPCHECRKTEFLNISARTSPDSFSTKNNLLTEMTSAFLNSGRLLLDLWQGDED
jgi:hypothetical protein